MFGLLDSSDYARFMEDMAASIALVNSPTRGSLFSPFSSPSHHSSQHQQHDVAAEEHHRSPPSQPTLTINGVLAMRDDEFVQMAKNNKGTKQMQQFIVESGQVRQKLLMIMADPKGGTQVLSRLATDSNGNFIVQKLIANEPTNRALLDAIASIAPKIALNRYGCRVVQKLIQILPPEQVRQFLNDHFKGIELQLLVDQNGNHIFLSIIHRFPPEIYIGFMRNLSKSPGALKRAMESKYGCRAIQAALEHAIALSFEFYQLDGSKQQDTGPTQPKMPSALDIRRGNNGGHYPRRRGPTAMCAFELYSLLVCPIVREAKALSDHEFGNYMVQTIIKNDFLAKDRRHIIKDHLIGNILDLAQRKFSSHVLEVAFQHADEQCLAEMMAEVLDGYWEGKPALHFILFSEYGNYVFQRLLLVADQVNRGRRAGNPEWLFQLVDYAYGVPRQLHRFSSGKKILDMIQSMLPNYPLHSFLPKP